MTSYTAIILDLPVSIYIASLVYRGVKTLNASGLILWLLIGLNISLFVFGFINIFVLVYSKNIIDATTT